MGVIIQSDDMSAPTVFPGRTDEIEEWPSKGAWAKPPDPSKTAETMTLPSKYLTSAARFDRWGFSAHLMALPGPKNTTYRASVYVSLIGKMDSVQLRLSTLGFTFAIDRKVPVGQPTARVESTSFVRLLLSHSFSSVTACDERGWTAFHRAAAIGTREDVQNFHRLGAEWYGRTALFFAASHDNVDTLRAIVEHSGSDDIFGILPCRQRRLDPAALRRLLSRVARHEHGTAQRRGGC